jgi:hypothetical protein
MKCETCGNLDAKLSKSGFYKGENGREYFSYCEKCGYVELPTFYDVNWKSGQPEKNLMDDKTGKPMEFISKGHKARWLRERGIVAMGDRDKGGTAFDNYLTPRKIDKYESLNKVKEVYREVKKMPREHRQKLIREYYGR